MASSSVVGHKRSREETEEVSPSCTCMVCLEVLCDPVTLLCGHSLDQRCLEKVLNAGQHGCPTCRAPLPPDVPSVNVQMREMVTERYPQQVGSNPNEGHPPMIACGDADGAGW